MKNFFAKIKEKYFMGLHGKIMKIVLILSGIMVVLFVGVTITLLHALHNTIEDVAVEESEIVEDSAKEALMNTTYDSFVKTITWAADQIDDEFWIMSHDYYVLREQVEDVLKNPSKYPAKTLEPPSKENEGKYALQFVYPENYDKNNPLVTERLARIANLEPMMREIVRGNEGYTMDCFVALPDGAAITEDNLSAGKFDENGNIKPYDATTRDWYKGAVEKGDIYFSEDMMSHFYKLRELTWGLPVYVDGELMVVLNGSSPMNALEKKLNERNIGETGFSVLISDKGHIVYSPKAGGELAQDDDNTNDIRVTANPSLAAVVTKAVNQDTVFSPVTLDGVDYYVAYAPVDSAGWTLMMFISQGELERDSIALQGKLSAASDNTLAEFDKYVKINAAALLIGLFIVVLVIAHVISLRTKKALKPISSLTEAVYKMDGDHMVFEMKEEYMTDNEIVVLAEAFSDMSVRLQSSLNEILKRTAEEERMNAEIDAASRIQLAMLPSLSESITSREEFDIYAHMVPAKHVGGDLYDFFLIDDNHLGIVVGDVSGKGISAALFMVLAKNTIQNQLMTYGNDVVSAVTEANKLLIRDNAAHLFVTAWVGVLTLDTGELRFVDAGHELAAVSKKGEEFTVEKDNHSIVMGMIDRVEFFLNEIQLQSGDTIYLFTDGVVEAKDINGDLFKKERMLDALNINPSLSPEELDKVVREKVDEFVGDAEQFDDITSLCLRYYGKNS